MGASSVGLAVLLASATIDVLRTARRRRDGASPRSRNSLPRSRRPSGSSAQQAADGSIGGLTLHHGQRHPGPGRGPSTPPAAQAALTYMEANADSYINRVDGVALTARASWPS